MHNRRFFDGGALKARIYIIYNNVYVRLFSARVIDTRDACHLSIRSLFFCFRRHGSWT